MGRPGKRERHAQKENWGKPHRRFRMWRAGPDVPGGAATYGPWGTRKRARWHAAELRAHAMDRREADRLMRLPRSLREAGPPKASEHTRQGAGLQPSAGAPSVDDS